MDKKLFVKPAEGLKLRRPERNHTHLPLEGDWVPNNRFWRSHIKDGSAVETEPPKPAKKPRSNA